MTSFEEYEFCFLYSCLHILPAGDYPGENAASEYLVKLSGTVLVLPAGLNTYFPLIRNYQ